MGRIALKSRISNHQWQLFKVENGQQVAITREELADLFEAKRIYYKAVYEGVK
ncbi:hypothetical protein VA249_29750 [Vibrio alfacsensis]|uniref:hypothetical protein n=1 Tax=Vibrio alfacsensis TaxID=1074311 RepID=UPI001BEF3B2E|nr:hypothetical protein [Vibrio alfacsensis]BBM66329.1 hypothetical protein VA249_29750 [Vibrio alfacsensis]